MQIDFPLFPIQYLVSEELLTGETSTIIEFAMSEYPEQGALACIHVAHNSYSNLLKIVILRPPPNQKLRNLHNINQQ